MSFTGIGLFAIQISAATACELSFGNKVSFEIVMQKYNEYKKQYERETKSVDKLDRKGLQNTTNGEIEYES